MIGSKFNWRIKYDTIRIGIVAKNLIDCTMLHQIVQWKPSQRASTAGNIIRNAQKHNRQFKKHNRLRPSAWWTQQNDDIFTTIVYSIKSVHVCACVSMAYNFMQSI